MKFFLFILLIAAAAVGWWLFTDKRADNDLERASEELATETRDFGDSISDKLKELSLDSESVEEELKETGRVIRRKAGEAGQIISDASADARITAAIKAKLVAHDDLSALKISVSTTEGIVTMSGSVDEPEQIGEAMLLALKTDGVKQVISTIQTEADSAPQQTPVD